jgi:uncharacterized protein
MRAVMTMGKQVRELPVEPGGQLGARSPLTFFLLVLALSTPIWLLGAVTRRPLTPDLPVSSFIWVVPVIAAAILVRRERGRGSVKALLRRAFDHRRIRAKGWYAPVLLLLPGVYAATYAALRVLELPLPTVQVPIVAGAVMFLAYFVAAEFEELGWSGYVLNPLQDRWTALKAGVVLGLVWAAFHLVPLIQHGRSAGWIAWWTLSSVSLRVLLTWIYNNTGRSVFAASLFHATGNLANLGPFMDFGPAGYPYHAQRITLWS